MPQFSHLYTNKSTYLLELWGLTDLRFQISYWSKLKVESICHSTYLFLLSMSFPNDFAKLWFYFWELLVYNCVKFIWGCYVLGMTTHSSILAWRIPWTEEPGSLQSIRLQSAGQDWSDLAHVLISHIAIFQCFHYMAVLSYLQLRAYALHYHVIEGQ